jgi:hypothetical protein
MACRVLPFHAWFSVYEENGLRDESNTRKLSTEAAPSDRKSPSFLEANSGRPVPILRGPVYRIPPALFQAFAVPHSGRFALEPEHAEPKTRIQTGDSRPGTIPATVLQKQPSGGAQAQRPGSSAAGASFGAPHKAPLQHQALTEHPHGNRADLPRTGAEDGAYGALKTRIEKALQIMREELQETISRCQQWSLGLEQEQLWQIGEPNDDTDTMQRVEASILRVRRWLREALEIENVLRERFLLPEPKPSKATRDAVQAQEHVSSTRGSSRPRMPRSGVSSERGQTATLPPSRRLASSQTRATVVGIDTNDPVTRLSTGRSAAKRHEAGRQMVQTAVGESHSGSSDLRAQRSQILEQVEDTVKREMILTSAASGGTIEAAPLRTPATKAKAEAPIRTAHGDKEEKSKEQHSAKPQMPLTSALDSHRGRKTEASQLQRTRPAPSLSARTRSPDSSSTKAVVNTNRPIHVRNASGGSKELHAPENATNKTKRATTNTGVQHTPAAASVAAQSTAPKAEHTEVPAGSSPPRLHRSPGILSRRLSRSPEAAPEAGLSVVCSEHDEADSRLDNSSVTNRPARVALRKVSTGRSSPPTPQLQQGLERLTRFGAARPGPDSRAATENGALSEAGSRLGRASTAGPSQPSEAVSSTATILTSPDASGYLPRLRRLRERVQKARALAEANWDHA